MRRNAARFAAASTPQPPPEVPAHVRIPTTHSRANVTSPPTTAPAYVHPHGYTHDRSPTGDAKVFADDADTIESLRRAREQFRRKAEQERAEHTFNETKSRHSTQAQWQERVARPVAAREMTPEEITYFRAVLANVERAADTGVRVQFRRIRDVNDEDRNDCMYLEYLAMRGAPGGRQHEQVIWRMKIPVPERIRQDKDVRMWQDAAASRPASRGRRFAIMPAPASAAQTPVSTPANTTRGGVSAAEVFARTPATTSAHVSAPDDDADAEQIREPLPPGPLRLFMFAPFDVVERVDADRRMTPLVEIS